MTFYVNPPTKCDLCDLPIGDEFSDAYVPIASCWCFVCYSCAELWSVRYGTGKGQRYLKRDDGKYHKVEG